MVGEVDKPETWAEVAGKASIIIGAVDNRPDFSDALIENVAKVARESGRKIIFIFTSGVWVSVGRTKYTTRRPIPSHKYLAFFFKKKKILDLRQPPQRNLRGD